MSNRVEYLNPEHACPPQGLYSHVTRVSAGPLLFIAGQLSVGSDGGIVGKNDFGRQFHQIFENLGAVLEGVGVGFKDIIKFSTFLVRSQDIEAFMQLRAAHFPKLYGSMPYPPNTLLVVDRLVKEEFLLEIEAVAATK